MVKSPKAEKKHISHRRNHNPNMQIEFEPTGLKKAPLPSRFESIMNDRQLNAMSLSMDTNNAIAYYFYNNDCIYSPRYGGIISDSDSIIFAEYARNAFIEYCRGLGAKRFMIRADPFLNTIKAGKLMRQEPFVWIDLTGSERDIMDAISKSHIKDIKKYEKELTYIHADDSDQLKIFYRLYKNASVKKKIRPHGFERFKKAFSELEGNIFVGAIKCEGRTIAASVILDDRENAYMTYGGMDEDGYRKHAKHAMIFNLILMLKNTGRKRLILGTGSQADDGIYRFKKGFTDRIDSISIFEGKIPEAEK